MADVLFLVVLAAFFGLCVVFVRACDRLVRKGAVAIDARGAGDRDPADELERAS